MSMLSEMANDIRESSAKSVVKETWSLSKENAFLNGVAEVVISLGQLPGETPDEAVIRGLQVYLQKSPARKRFLVTLTSRIRQRERFALDEGALTSLIEKIKTRVTHAKTDPKNLVDRIQRFVARL